MRTRYLPPGTLTWLRVRWLLLGVAIGVAGAAGLAMYLAAILPPELAYRSPTATARPVPGPVSALPPAVVLAPCTGQGKDCSEPDADRRTQPDDTPAQLFPAPDAGRRTEPNNQPLHTVPEPGALALVALGLAALAAHRSHA